MAPARAYLDHASTAPLRPAALAAMRPFLESSFGDPGRLHTEGRTTRVALENARDQVAAFFGARPREVVFTSSGTEAVNTAIVGALAARRLRRAWGHHRDRALLRARRARPRRGGGNDRRRRPNGSLRSRRGRRRGAGRDRARQRATRESRGRHAATRRRSMRRAARARGARTRRRVRGRRARGRRLRRARRRPLLGDGPQVRWTARRGRAARAPRSAAAASARRRRAGTRPPGRDRERPRLGRVRRRVCGCRPGRRGRGAAGADRPGCRGRRAVPDVERFGDGSLPNLLCLGVGGVEAEPILLALDQHGVAVHSGSACSSETLEPSPVLEAMGVDADRSLRVSVGWSSTPADVERFVEVFPGIVERLRGLRAT